MIDPMTVDTPSGALQTQLKAHHAPRTRGPWIVPVLEARSGSAPARFAAQLSGRHPVTVFLAAIFSGLALIAAISIGLGLLVTKVLVPAWGIGAADERVAVWLAGHRTASRGDASLIGSMLAGGVVLPIIAGVIALAFLALRHWRLAAFTVFALGVESGSYRITTLAVHRHRPSVVRLEHLPVNASYPSGHTAAAIAVYAGLVLLLTSKFRNSAFRVSAWTIAVALPVFVAWARMYRGMHHPLDVAGGVVIGVAALIVLVFASRAADAAAPASR
jgi:membrane-associated phospholipid phosphatase